jgi:amino acid transporter
MNNRLVHGDVGVFPKILRNMWVASAIFNPLLSLFSMGVLPLSIMIDEQEVVLANMALKVAGRWLQIWVSIDAFMVLSGAVITAFVGVTGLITRLAGDRCLPQVCRYCCPTGDNHDNVYMK